MRDWRAFPQLALGFLMLTGGIMHFTIDPARWHLPLIDALKATGYLWELIAAINMLAGTALLVNRLVPLALLMLAPISLNILLIHLANPGAGGIPIGVVIAGLQIILTWVYRLEFRHLFTRNLPLQSGGRAAHANATPALEG